MTMHTRCTYDVCLRILMNRQLVLPAAPKCGMLWQHFFLHNTKNGGFHGVAPFIIHLRLGFRITIYFGVTPFMETALDIILLMTHPMVIGDMLLGLLRLELLHCQGPHDVTHILQRPTDRADE